MCARRAKILVDQDITALTLIVSFSSYNLSPFLRLSERRTISTMLMSFRYVLVLLVPVILAGGAMAADAGTCSLLLPSRRCCPVKQPCVGTPRYLIIDTVMLLKLIGLLEVLNTVSLITKGYINAYAGVTYFIVSTHRNVEADRAAWLLCRPDGRGAFNSSTRQLEGYASGQTVSDVLLRMERDDQNRDGPGDC